MATKALCLRGEYAGSSIDDTLAQSDSAKGVFFGHFKSNRPRIPLFVNATPSWIFETLESVSKRADAVGHDLLESLLIPVNTNRTIPTSTFHD